MIALPAPTAAVAFVVVEQLNRAQWHASSPIGSWRTSGVQNYAGTLADALWMAAGTSLGVLSIDLAGQQRILKHPEAQ